jgi:hypothetical protein
VLAEPGDGRLLGGAQRQLGLRVLLVGDVRQHAVPAPDAVLALDHQRVVAEPDGVAVPMQQAVLQRAGEHGAVGELRLIGEHPLGVVGV